MSNCLRKIPANPKLPADFYGTPNEERPPSHMLWWERPYIVRQERVDGVEESEWLA